MLSVHYPKYKPQPMCSNSIKNHTFEELKLTFEIAKPLILTGCAIRFQRMRYDHFSPKTATYYPRPKASQL